MTAYVYVSLKKSVLDPQGKTIHGALKKMGYKGVDDVRQGKFFEITGEELLARALQHEIDHLNGKLYISHISALKRDLMKRKIRKLAKAGEW